MNARRVKAASNSEEGRYPTPADLGRTFSEAREGDDTESSVSRYLRRSRGEPQDWPWLLRSPLVVILNEAGAGKTWEIRRQVQLKIAAGQDAFFLPLERLARHDGDHLFESPEQRDAFRRWRASRRTATMFLDALDEAKLPSSADANPLQIALRRLEERVGDRGWARVRLVISSRPSAYKRDEEAEIERLAAKFRARGLEGPCPQIVKLDPLEFDQQSRLAAYWAAPPDFITKLRDRGALDLAPTPLDLEDLLDAYRAEADAGRDGETIFKDLSTVVDRAIAWRIEGRQTSRPRSRLSPQRARQGARRLACAAVLGPSLAIRTPGAPGHGVDAIAALNGRGGDWSVGEVDELLACGLFTAAWDGRVHFHHRRTLDRLAAEAFDDLMTKGLALAELAAILTPSAYEQPTAPAAFHGVLGWLATLNPAFRDYLLRVAPQLLIEEGDPSRLPLPIRERALENHVARYRQIRWRQEWMDFSRAQRFVDPALAPTINRLLTDPDTAEEPAGHLIALAEMGGLSACADALLVMALNPDRTPTQRALAVNGLVDLGGPSHLAAIKAMARTLRWPRDNPDTHTRYERNTLHFACVLATISISTPREVLTVLLRLQAPSKSYATDDSRTLAQAIAKAWPDAALARLLGWLSRLCWTRRDQPITMTDAVAWTPLGWFLLPALEAVAARCARERPDTLDTALLARETERLLNVARVINGPTHRHDPDERHGPLAAALQAAPWLRQAIFELWLEEQTEGRPSQAGHHLEDRIQSSQPLDDDLPWLLDGYRRNASGPAAEAYASALAGRLWRLPARIATPWLQAVRDVAKAKGDRAAIQDLPTCGQRWRSTVNMELRRRWWRSPVRKYLRSPERIGRDLALARTVLRLRLAARDLAAPRHEGLAYWALRHHLHEKDPLAQVRARYGQAIADGVLFAAKAYARRFTPQGPVGRSTEATAFAGLGWSLIAMDEPDALNALDEDRARAALTVGLAQQSLPVWTRDLAHQRLAMWRAVVASPLQAEIDRLKAGDRAVASLVSTLARLDDALQQPLAGLVADELVEPGALPRFHIRDLFEIARADPATRDVLLTLARRLTRQHLASGQVWAASAWLNEWMGFDSAAAWAEIRRWRDGIWGDSDVMIGLFEGLSDRLSLNVLSPLVAADFAIDIHRHLADVEDEDGVHTVTASHRARDLKRGVLPFLARDPSPAARVALSGLLEAPQFVEDRGWILRLLSDQAGVAAAPRDWTALEVADVLDTWLRAPDSAEALLTMTQRQLSAIAEDLKTAEFDLRGLFRNAVETDVRAFFGEALRRRSQRWFDVTQETVTSGENRTDLRLSADVGIVIVELKLADKTTASALRERLENQLLKQYLISREVRHGLFAVVRAAEKQAWTLPSGDVTDFPGLIAWLQSEAALLEAACQGVTGLRVIGLDVALPKPARTRRGGRAATSL